MSFSNYLKNLERKKVLSKKLFESTSNDPTEINTNIINFFNHELNTNYKFIKVGIYNNESFGTIDGALYISENKSAIRINWLENNLVGISYWSSFNTKYIDYEFEFSGDDTVKKLKDNIHSIATYIKTASYNELNDDGEETLNLHGDYYVYNFSHENEIIVDKDGCTQLIDNIFDLINENDKQKILNSFIKSISKKLNKSLLILGADKTKNFAPQIKEILDSNSLKENQDYVIKDCQVDNDLFIKTIYNYKDKILVFNYADNMLLKSDDIAKTTRQLLIPNLSKTFTIKDDDGNGNTNTKDFEFTGSIILITSVTKDRMRNKDKEIISKCLTFKMKSENEDSYSKIKKQIKDIHIYTINKIGSDAKEVHDENLLNDVIEYLTSEEFITNKKNKTNSFNFDILQNTFLIAKSRNKNWKSIALDLL